jgi:hypothetical protein
MQQHFAGGSAQMGLAEIIPVKHLCTGEPRDLDLRFSLERRVGQAAPVGSHPQHNGAAPLLQQAPQQLPHYRDMALRSRD